jgi:1-phosphatidylinositol phosphodiesterase
MLVLLTFIFSLCLAFASTQALYNHNSASYVNQTWMTNLDDGIPIRQMTILGTHSSMSQGTWGDAFQTQASSITTQLNSGVRALDIRCNHKNNKLYAYERMINLNTELSGVLSQVGSFLARFPG